MFHHTIKCFVSAVVNEDCFKIKKKFFKKFMIVPFSRGQSHINNFTKKTGSNTSYDNKIYTLGLIGIP